MDNKDHSGEFIEKLSHKWTRLAKASKTISAPRASTEPDRAFYVRIFKINKLPIPKFLLDKADDVRNFQVHIHISATLFDFHQRAFFGNTWVGNRVDLKNATKGGPTSWNGMEALACNVEFSTGSGLYGFVFHTTLNLEAVRLVYEVVVTVLDAKGEVRIEEYSMCWCVADFTTKGDIEKLSNQRSQAEKATSPMLMAGTPRLLIFTGADKTVLGKAKIEGATLNQVSLTHGRLTQLLQTVHCMAENELCGGTDPVIAAIPGITAWDTAQPKPEPTCTLEVQGAMVKVPADLGAKLTAYVKKATGSDLTLHGVSLSIGVHNGRRFLADPAKVALTAGARGEYKGAGKVVLKEYVPSPLVAVVVLAMAQVEAGGQAMDICLGWVPLVPLEADKSGGKLLVGPYSVALRTSAPMLSVSTLLVFADADGKVGRAAVEAAPRLTLSLGKDPRGGGTGSVRTQPLRERLQLLVGLRPTMQSEPEANEEEAGGGAAEKTEAVKKEETREEEGGTEGKSEGSEGPAFQTYTLVCDVSEIGKGDAKVQLNHISIEDESDQVFDALEDKFDVEVAGFEYLPAGAQEPIFVDDDESFFKFLDWAEVTFPDDPAPKIPIVVVPVEDDESPREQQAKAPAKPAVVKPPTPTKPADPANKASEETPDARMPLKTFTLVCQRNGKPGGRVEGIAVSSTWTETAERIRKELGVSGEVVLGWVDANEEESEVRDKTGWQMLIEDVAEDWLGARELDGEVDVEILDAQTQRTPDQPAPTPTATGKIEQQTQKEQRKASLTPLKPPSPRVDQPGSRRASPKAPTPPPVRPPSPKPPTPVKQPSASPPARLPASDSPKRPVAKQQEPEDEEAYSEDEEEYSEEDEEDEEEGSEEVEEYDDDAISESEVAFVEELEQAAIDFDPPKPLVLAEKTKDLSRRTRSELLKQSQSQLVQRSARVSGSASAVPKIGDLRLEVADKLRGSNILFHILAVRPPPAVQRLFFSLRFYNFSTVRTPALKVVRAEGAPFDAPADLVMDGEAQSGRAQVEQEDGAKGVTLRFQVSPMEAASPSQPTDALFFARYLDTTALEVCCYDADSLLPIGAAYVSLRPLLRQGRESVQSSGEFPLFDSLAPHLVQASSSTLPYAAALTVAALPNTLHGAPAEEKGSLLLRMVNIAVPYPDAPQVTVRPLSSKADAPVHELIDAHGTAGELEWKGMALVYAHRSEIARELRKGNIAPETLSVNDLQKAVFACKVPLSVRQVTLLGKRLAEEFGGDGKINIRELHSASKRAISAAKEDDDTKDLLAHHVMVLTGILGSRYGGLDRAFDWIAEGKTITLKLFREMVARAKELHAGLNISDAECKLIFDLMEPEPTGVTRQGFADFFGIVIGDGKPGMRVRKSELDERNRKLARWTKLQLARQGLTDEEDLNKKQMLSVVQVMRESQKAKKITEFLSASLTASVNITLGFGELHYFQHTIQNPYKASRFVKIRLDDPEVTLITDPKEWRDLHRMFDGSEQEFDTVVERSKDDRTLLHVHVNQGQSVKLPFKVRSLKHLDPDDSTAASAGSREPRGWTIEGTRAQPESRTVLVSFSFQKGVNGEEDPLGGLNVTVQYRASVIDRAFHFYHAHHEDFRKRIMVDSDDPWAGWRLEGKPGTSRSPLTFVESDDQSVVIKNLPIKSDFQQFEIGCRCREAGSRQAFHLLLYKDSARSSLWAIYKIVIHPLMHSIVKGLTGSIDRNGFVGARRPGREAEDLPATAFSSKPDLLNVDCPEAELTLSPQLKAVPLAFRPLEQGRVDVLVHFMARDALAKVAAEGTSAAEVTCACLVTTIAKKPFIANRYSIKLRGEQHCAKKISYSNRYEEDKVFKLRTNRPDILEFRHHGRVPIAAKATGYMKLKFAAPTEPTEVLLFVNNDENQNEECLVITVDP